MQSHQELPIDIHTNKLLDWLVSRRHCTRDYTNDVLIIREKINGAIQDMPALEEITKLLSGTYINYFHCLQIVELLKKTESESKNIFGRYSSQRMKDWQEIVKLYQKDNVYLAEAAQMLIRNVNFEVPSLKRQVANLRLLQLELDKKHNDCIKNAKDVRDRYHQSCTRLGIKGKDVREELLEAVKGLPATYKKVLKCCKSLSNVKVYYKEFIGYVLGSKTDDSADVLPMTSYLLKKGNTTVYEWKFGKPPLEIVEVVGEPNLKNLEEESEEIDFGGNSVDLDVNEIDFGADSEIDFGEGDNQNTDENAFAKNKPSDGVARGDNSLTILVFNDTRSLLMSELFELESFLDQRLIEMQVESDLLAVNQFQSAGACLQSQSVESVRTMLTSVHNIIDLLSDAKLQQLFLIKASPRYVDRLSDTLKQQLSIADKMINKSEELLQKRKEALEKEVLLGPKIDLIISKTKDLQKEIEKDISNRYSNRIVNVMGGISVL